MCGVCYKEEMKWQQFGAFVTIPFVLALPPIIGWFLGRLLDKYLHTSPYLMYLFLLLGIAAGIKEFIHIIKKYGNKT